ncbi:SCP2 sterol-binding domain-containing protein [Candidatus Solincola tengchongensis]|uniref:SCP2 sterol-binding domain-containing protein n=1 Tax=Candidatus Solincola tengchongensis TaxID=2900693 RepID=UPI00257C5894|nr:SCP2 sterol-binding domain-containing protein [Candidatus Solincola tengchongensis]
MAYVYGTTEWEEAFEGLVGDLSEVEKPPYIMGTPAWIGAYRKLIQEDETYRRLARGWEGSVVIHILPEPGVGLEDDMYLMLDLWNGECRSVRLVPRSVGEEGDYVLTADYHRWKQVMTGELDATKGMIQGKIRLKGNLPTIVRYAKAATRLTELVGMVDTIFLDEIPPEEVEAFKPWVDFIREEFSLSD